jgi:hypothetical protein
VLSIPGRYLYHPVRMEELFTMMKMDFVKEKECKIGFLAIQ